MSGSLSSLLHTSSRLKDHAQEQLNLYLPLTQDGVSKCPGHMEYRCIINLGYCHEGPEGEYSYGSTLPLTSVLDGVGGKRHAPATLPPGKRPGTDCNRL